MSFRAFARNYYRSGEGAHRWSSNRRLCVCIAAAQAGVEIPGCVWGKLDQWTRGHFRLWCVGVTGEELLEEMRR